MPRAVFLLGLAVLLALVLAACSVDPNPKAQDAVLRSEVQEMVQAAENRSWTLLAPGFYYSEHKGGVAFRIRFEEFAPETLPTLRSRVNSLTSNQDAHGSNWKYILGVVENAYPRFQQAYPELLKLLSPMPGDSIQQSNGVTPLSFGCSASASALPTTAAPGAKAYANANCSSYTPTVSARTNAWANSQNNICNDSGMYGASCSSVQYGASGCGSLGEAQAYVYYNSFNYLLASDYDSHSGCY